MQFEDFLLELWGRQGFLYGDRLCEGDGDAGEWFWDDEFVPGFESPGVGVGDVDGDDSGACCLCDFDDSGLHGIARAAWAVGCDADVGAIAKGIAHADEC